MSEKHLGIAPIGIETKNISKANFSFDCPATASIVEFDLEESFRLRVLISIGEVIHRVNIEPWHDSAQDPKTSAEEEYSTADRAYDDENLPPYQLELGDLECWRIRKRFVDGFQSPLILDIVFIKKNDAVYRIEYAIAPEHYSNGLWFFDLVVRTFKIGDL